MPRKRKLRAGLHYRKKHFRQDNSFIEIQTKSMEQDLNNHFTSTAQMRRKNTKTS